MSRRPERLAAAARMLQPLLLDSLALQAERIADDLAANLGLVAWERERLIGHVQEELMRLRERRFGRLGGQGVRVLERRLQPLECLAPTWSMLRQGRPVHVEAEPGAVPQVLHLLRAMAQLIPEEGLSVAEPGASTDQLHADWPLVGVEPAESRIALIQEDADPELAAYLLARGCLRRTGFDPRSIHRAIVVGRSERLERHLRRLWLGATMGPVDDDGAFAGPVTEAEAEAYLAAERVFSRVQGARVLCAAGRLEHVAHDRARPVFLAPALIRVPADAEPTIDPSRSVSHKGPLPLLAGPLLLLHPCEDAAEGESLLGALAGPRDARLRIGPRPPGVELGPMDRQIHGALLVERLPPGLPDPRP